MKNLVLVNANKHNKTTGGLRVTSFAFKYSSVMFLQKIKTYISTLSVVSIPICTQPAVSTQARPAAQPQLTAGRDQGVGGRRARMPRLHPNSERPVSESLKYERPLKLLYTKAALSVKS